jgi:hypothetical protein
MSIEQRDKQGETWLEPESLCYPSGRMLRRCKALCEDGKTRIVRCGIPDTFFSIPGYFVRKGKRVKGFISQDSGGPYTFTAYKGQG